MKQILGLFLIATFTFSIMTANAEPISQEEFMKIYQPKIDKVITEKLSPRKQLELGILMLDVFCFDDKIRILKFSDQNLVACVNRESVQQLVDRGWGITKNEDMFTENSSHGTECGNTLTISFKDKAAPASTIIHKIRKVMNEFAEILLWQPITIISESTPTEWVLNIRGSYNLQEQIKLKDTIRTIPGVLSIELVQNGCI